MDLNSIKDQVSNLTLYDLKAGVRKVQNGEGPPTETMLDTQSSSCHSRYELH